MTSSLTSVVGRISELDVLIRSVDPSWSGLPTDAVGATTSLRSSVLSAATTTSSGTAAPFGQVLSQAGSAIISGGTSGGTSSVASADRMTSPLPGSTLTQPFGPTSLTLEPPATINGVTYAHFHAGVDLAAPLGTPVLAAADGTVVAAGRASDGAVIVRLRHADGSETLYGHLRAGLPVAVGDHVVAGQQIGAVGLTGNTTGPHLHFALTVAGTPVDPQPWLRVGVLPGARTATGSIETAATAGSTPAADSAAGTTSAAALADFDTVASTIPHASEIRAAAVSAGVDPLLLASLVKAESGFHPDAVSSAGAMGLTQLMPATAKSLGVTAPFDPVQNLNAGARYLASDLRLFGRVDLALAAYQAGKGAVRQYGGVPPYPSTQAYIRHILTSWSGYLAAGGTAGAGAVG